MTNEIIINGMKRRMTMNSEGLSSLTMYLEEHTTTLTNHTTALNSHATIIHRHTDCMTDQQDTVSCHERIIDAVTEDQNNLYASHKESQDSGMITAGIFSTHSDQIQTIRETHERFAEQIVAACYRKDDIFNTRIKYLHTGRKALICKTEEQNAIVEQQAKALEEGRSRKGLIVEYLRTHSLTNIHANRFFQKAIYKTYDGQMAPLLIRYMTALSSELGAAQDTLHHIPS